jgi:hypothetical protein
VFRLDRVSVKECTVSDNSCGCSTVPEIQAKELILWPNEIELCGKRDSDLTYSKIWERQNSEGKCDNGWKKCGNVDGQSEGVCIPQAKNCPISSMVFASSNPDTNIYDQEITGQSLNVYYSNSKSQDPLTDLRSGEAHICMGVTKIGITVERKPYVLSNYQEHACTSDERFTKNGLQELEQAFLAENGVDISNLPTYESTNDHKYYGFERSMITFKPSCRNELGEMMEGQDIVDKLKTFLTILLVRFLIVNF